MHPRALKSLVVSTVICVLSVVSTGAIADPTLADAIRAGDRATALKMMQEGADVNAAQADGTTPLQWATYRNDLELVKALLARGAKAKVTNSFGASPLSEAVKIANLDLVTQLLKAGADVESPNADGQTVLMLAARNGSVEIARALLKYGANLNAVETWRGQTALMWAAAQKHPEVVELLVAQHAKVDVAAEANDWGEQITSEPRAQYRPTGGLTALMYAARSGCIECARALLRGHADINMPSPDGVTPLLTALDNLHYDLAKMLIEQGANPNTWDWWGRTPLYVAVDMHSYPASRVAYNGPKVNVVVTDKTRCSDMIRLILAAGVNPNPQLNMHRPGRGGNSQRFVENLLTTGATPLLRAAVAQDAEAVQILLEHHALVDLPNVMGVTPLIAASGMGISINDPRPLFEGDMQGRALATLELLVKAGADVNARVLDTTSHNAKIARPSSMTDRQGQTALYGPVIWGWTRVARFLLEHGARTDIVDAAGKGPLDLILKGDVANRDHKADDEMVSLIRTAAVVTH